MNTTDGIPSFIKTVIPVIGYSSADLLNLSATKKFLAEYKELHGCLFKKNIIKLYCGFIKKYTKLLLSITKKIWDQS